MVPAQEAHAKAILESSTNLRDIRFKLCPSQLRDEVDCVSPHVARLHRLHTPAARRLQLCRRTQPTAGPLAPSATVQSLGTRMGQRAGTVLARTSCSYCSANVNTLTRCRSVFIQDFWQIYFIVTQKDGVEAVEQQSLGSSWGTCPSYSMGIVSSDENEAGLTQPYNSPAHALVPVHPHLLTAHVPDGLGRRYIQHRVCLL